MTADATLIYSEPATAAGPNNISRLEEAPADWIELYTVAAVKKEPTTEGADKVGRCIGLVAIVGTEMLQSPHLHDCQLLAAAIVEQAAVATAAATVAVLQVEQPDVRCVGPEELGYGREDLGSCPAMPATCSMT